MKAVAMEQDGDHGNSITWKRNTSISSRGRQGQATMSAALFEGELPNGGGNRTIPKGFLTASGWIPFRDSGDHPIVDPRVEEMPGGGEMPWKLVKWNEVPIEWANGLPMFGQSVLAICVPDQEETRGYARFFRAIDTDQRITVCVDTHYEQVYGVEAGISCLNTLVLTGKPSLRFCLLVDSQQ